jgi:hypothetical protein
MPLDGEAPADNVAAVEAAEQRRGCRRRKPNRECPPIQSIAPISGFHPEQESLLPHTPPPLYCARCYGCAGNARQQSNNMCLRIYPPPPRTVTYTRARNQEGRSAAEKCALLSNHPKNLCTFLHSQRQECAHGSLVYKKCALF